MDDKQEILLKIRELSNQISHQNEGLMDMLSLLSLMIVIATGILIAAIDLKK